MNARAKGGGLRAVPFRFINCVDFEFRAGRGNRPEVVCMVVHEVRSGETRRYWKDEIHKMPRAPFETGPDAVMAAYAAQAEHGCILAQEWPRPDNTVDQYAEFRAQTNGVRRNASLLDAMARRIDWLWRQLSPKNCPSSNIPTTASLPWSDVTASFTRPF
jgi:hypothetical protein